MVIGAAIYFMLPPSLTPTFQQSDVRVSWEAEPGTSHDAMMATIAQLNDELTAINGVENGVPMLAVLKRVTLNVAINSADLWINLADGANRDTVVNEISTVTANYQVTLLRSKPICLPISQKHCGRADS
ncbi:MAG: hypothetical protein R2867_14190 [Caldilineaceae bacterium]